MQTSSSSTGFRPDEAFTGAAERFFELLKTFGMPGVGKVPDWSSLAAPLERQFEQWLRMSQSAAPGVAAAASGGDQQQVFELMGRLAQLQGQLASHWSQIAHSASQRFVARLGTAAPPVTLDQALKVYELWVSCAEEAYAATVHREDFSRLQGELANTSAALLVEQRRHAEALVRAFGFPSRSEVDALYAQVKELRRQLAELANLPRAAGRGADKRAGNARARSRARPAPARAKRSAARGSGKRARGRGSRR